MSGLVEWKGSHAFRIPLLRSDFFSSSTCIWIWCEDNELLNPSPPANCSFHPGLAAAVVGSVSELSISEARERGSRV